MKKITYIVVFAVALLLGTLTANAQSVEGGIYPTVTVTTSNENIIAGKVVDSLGRKLQNVIVSTVGDDGNIIMTLTNSYGLYILESGQITPNKVYTIKASYKKMVFSPIVVETVEDSASYANFQTFSR